MEVELREVMPARVLMCFELDRVLGNLLLIGEAGEQIEQTDPGGARYGRCVEESAVGGDLAIGSQGVPVAHAGAARLRSTDEDVADGLDGVRSLASGRHRRGTLWDADVDLLQERDVPVGSALVTVAGRVARIKGEQLCDDVGEDLGEEVLAGSHVDRGLVEVLGERSAESEDVVAVDVCGADAERLAVPRPRIRASSQLGVRAVILLEAK